MDVSHERSWILEIVEHRKGRHDPGLLCTEAITHGLRREEVRDQPDVRRIIRREFLSCGVDTDELEILGKGLQSSPVIAAHVDDEIPARNRNPVENRAHLPLEMLYHRVVEPGPIAIIPAVHPAEVARVPELQETAMVLAMALDQLERHPFHFLPLVLRKDASQRLIAEVENRHKLRVFADPAASDLAIHGVSLQSARDRARPSSERPPRT